MYFDQEPEFFDVKLSAETRAAKHGHEDVTGYVTAATFMEVVDVLLDNEAEVIGQLIEVLVERLDALAGESDIEDDDPDFCGAGDDGFHPLYVHGHQYWGVDDRAA